MILFSLEVYLRVIERYAEDFWPLPIVALVLAVGVAIICLKPGKPGYRLAALFLSASWLWIGVVYYGLRFTGLNWAAWISSGLFVVQGLLFVWYGVVRNRIDFGFERSSIHWVGAAFMLVALVVYPGLGALSGLQLSATQVVGFNPEPTILFTLAILLLASGRSHWSLIILPLLHALISGIAGWMMEWPYDTVLLIAAPVTVGMIWWNRRGGQKSDNSLHHPKSAHGADAEGSGLDDPGAVP